jgi:SAM-dependent methyltransferase
MYEILDHLGEDAIVLDMGSGPGSFPDSATRARVIRVDLFRPDTIPSKFALADALALPFRNATFDAVILNHSLEHLPKWKLAVQELGRILKRSGAAYIAVPDATTLTDRVYRRMYEDRGGHVNAFIDPKETCERLSWFLSRAHTGTRVLHSSFIFQNRRNHDGKAVKFLLRLLILPEPVLALAVRLIRSVDKRSNARLGVYGWAFYFGELREPVDPTPCLNVCVRCGQGHPTAYLGALKLVRRTFLPWARYRCPNCGCDNWFAPDDGKSLNQYLS